MNPPDPTAHDQVHDWAEERGLQSVDLVVIPEFRCPGCRLTLYATRGDQWGTGGEPLDDHNWVYIDACAFCDCAKPSKKCRIPVACFTMRYPCETEFPEPEHERSYRESLSASASKAP